MATQGGASRLAQMQMRFQQKQQEEREQRRLELTGPSKSNLDADDTKTINSSFGAGKVRQMFDERRKGAGIDKSYPLKPIVGRTTPGTTTTGASRTSSMTTTTTVRKSVGGVKQTNGTVKTETRKTTTATRSLNGNTSSITTNEYSTNNNDFLDSESMPASPDFLNGNDVPDFAKLSIRDTDELNGNFFMGDRNNNSNTSSGKSDSIKLKPVITKKTAPLPSRTIGTPSPAARVAMTTTTIRSSLSKPSPVASTRPKPSVVKTPPRSAAGSIKSISSATSSASGTPKTGSPVKSLAAPRPAPAAAGPIPDNMVQCSICGRNFNNDRIEKHQEICQKTATKKRKVFDVVKHRVQGTEIEQYVRKAGRTNTRAAKTTTSTATAAAAAKKNNWRRKHEEFIAAIRAAKEMQAHLAKGGKLSDLPPPPPSENPDYVQCPHCQRRFNEGAAARHIPKCADMRHNKPKPGAAGAKAPPRKR